MFMFLLNGQDVMVLLLPIDGLNSEFEWVGKFLLKIDFGCWIGY